MLEAESYIVMSVTTIDSWFNFLCACARAHVGVLVCERVHVHARVALLIQHATPMRRISLSFVASLSLSITFFDIILKMERFFGKKIYLTQNVCFDFLYNFCSKTFPILRRIQRDIVKNVKTLSYTVPVLVRF
jgi:hypothetical protein